MSLRSKHKLMIRETRRGCFKLTSPPSLGKNHLGAPGRPGSCKDSGRSSWASAARPWSATGCCRASLRCWSTSCRSHTGIAACQGVRPMGAGFGISKPLFPALTFELCSFDAVSTAVVSLTFANSLFGCFWIRMMSLGWCCLRARGYPSWCWRRGCNRSGTSGLFCRRTAVAPASSRSLKYFWWAPRPSPPKRSSWPETTQVVWLDQDFRCWNQRWLSQWKCCQHFDLFKLSPGQTSSALRKYFGTVRPELLD